MSVAPTAPAVDPRVGTVIAEKYLIESVLGQGGMGRVYLAKHLGLGASVALKFLLQEHSNIHSLQERFRREATALARVRHPGVVSILDFGEVDGQAYMAMEYVAGAQLSDLLGVDVPPLPLHRIGDLYTQILDVLVAAHDKGVVHRDLKPDNVLLVSSHEGPEYVKVLDFGLAAFTHGAAPKDIKLTDIGVVQGTPTYMSPEQCRGHEVGPPTDVYAWGAMLFYALSGVPPFEADDMAALMTQHMFVEPPRASDVGLKRSLSSGMESVLRDALAKRPEQRPNAAQMRERFLAALAGTDPEALQQRAADERTLAAGFSREDRALTGIAARPEGLRTSSAPAYPGGVETFPRVVLWARQADAAVQSVQSALSVAGMRVTLWSKDTPPPDTLHGDPVALVVIHASLGFEAAARCTFAPSLVICVQSSADAPQWVRAGVGDIVMQNCDSETTARKARRMLRRGR